MPFDCTIEREGETMVVVPEGDVDVVNAAVLRQVLQQVVERRDCTRLDIDMSAVTFLDSSGLGMLVAAQRAAAAQGIALQLQKPGPMVRMVLEVTNLDRVLAPDLVADETTEAAAES
ncbi:STAS domain-containing protein [Couchioplanes caeruleus]|uniref:STAS domain-containing protein n=1 Tax=Couchioplanes caeruleus TaxID=56438 RepID=UPI0020C057CC|nr:STAS domain-containing protein [Couchioplanes caeruleus]UQU62493.1 STAS domain-containing protein [Couchioplanes caeruleus]